MAVTLTTTIQTLINATIANTIGLAVTSGNVSRLPQYSLASGVGANQADRMYSASLTLGASATSDLDLAGGALTDVFGSTITFARVKAVYVYADPTNTNNVVLGGAAATQWPGPFGAVAHTIAVRPGGQVMFIAPDATGWPVTGGASDLFRVANSAAGTSVVFDIIIIGASA